MEPAVAARRPCFAAEDDGLASLASGTETGSSVQAKHFIPIFSRSICSARGGFCYRNALGGGSSPRSPATRVYDARFEEHQPHFLDSCFLCKKTLGNNRDIFMYRGDTPFCSEECRQEQIDMDEAKEKNWNISSIKALRNKEQRSSNSPSKAQDYTYHASTVAAA